MFKFTKYFLIISTCIFLQGCPHHVVKQVEEQEKRLEEYRKKRPVYLTHSKDLKLSIDLQQQYSLDSVNNYDSLIQTGTFPIKFEINKIESDNFPEKIEFRTLVYDTNGRYISGLAPPYFTGEGSWRDYWKFLSDSCKGDNYIVKDFEVEEVRNNQNKPYSIAFILDHSSSMGKKRIIKLREAVKHVLYAIKKEDMIGIAKFAGKSVLEVPFSDEQSFYRKSFVPDDLNNGNHGGGTAMYDAIDFVMNQFDTVDNKFKKVIILFSDGGDNQSKVKIDSILKSAKKNKVEIYTIAYGYSDKNIEELAKYTGGRFYPIISTKEFPYVFKDIYTTLNNYYKITYTPKDCYDKHEISVRLNLPFMKDTYLESKGQYDKSVFTESDPVGTVYLMNVEFDIGKSDIKEDSKEQITLIAQSLRNNPAMKIKISGHTDNTGSDEFNEKLSVQRAMSVMNELIRLGIDGKRLSYAGYGKSRPLVPNNSDENRKRNRRTEFEIIEK